jgi:hypothetical protein
MRPPDAFIPGRLAAPLAEPNVHPESPAHFRCSTGLSIVE